MEDLTKKPKLIMPKMKPVTNKKVERTNFEEHVGLVYVQMLDDAHTETDKSKHFDNIVGGGA